MSKCFIFPTTRGIDYLGYRHFPQGYKLVRKTTAKRIKKRMARLEYNYNRRYITLDKALGQLASANGWLKHANSHNLQVAVDLERLTNKFKYINKQRTCKRRAQRRAERQAAELQVINAA